MARASGRRALSKTITMFRQRVEYLKKNISVTEAATASVSVKRNLHEPGEAEFKTAAPAGAGSGINMVTIKTELSELDICENSGLQLAADQKNTDRWHDAQGNSSSDNVSTSTRPATRSRTKPTSEAQSPKYIAREPECTKYCMMSRVKCSDKLSAADRRMIRVRFWKKLTKYERIAEIRQSLVQIPRRKYESKAWKLITPEGKAIHVCQRVFASTLGLEYRTVRRWVARGITDHSRVLNCRRQFKEKKRRKSKNEGQFPFLDGILLQFALDDRGGESPVSLYRRYLELASAHGELTVSEPIFRKRWSALKSTSLTLSQENNPNVETEGWTEENEPLPVDVEDVRVNEKVENPKSVRPAPKYQTELEPSQERLSTTESYIKLRLAPDPDIDVVGVDNVEPAAIHRLASNQSNKIQPLSEYDLAFLDDFISKLPSIGWENTLIASHREYMTLARASGRRAVSNSMFQQRVKLEKQAKFRTAEPLQLMRDWSKTSETKTVTVITDSAESHTDAEEVSQLQFQPLATEQRHVTKTDIKENDDVSSKNTTTLNLIRLPRRSSSSWPTCAKRLCKKRRLECDKISAFDRQRINRRFWNHLTKDERIKELISSWKETKYKAKTTNRWKLKTPEGREFRVCKNAVARILGLKCSTLSLVLRDVSRVSTTFGNSKRGGEKKTVKKKKTRSTKMEERFAFLDEFLLQFAENDRRPGSVSSLYRRYIELTSAQGEISLGEGAFRRRWAALKRTFSTPSTATDRPMVRTEIWAEGDHALPVDGLNVHVDGKSDAMVISGTCRKESKQFDLGESNRITKSMLPPASNYTSNGKSDATELLETCRKKSKQFDLGESNRITKSMFPPAINYTSDRKSDATVILKTCRKESKQFDLGESNRITKSMFTPASHYTSRQRQPCLISPVEISNLGSKSDVSEPDPDANSRSQLPANPREHYQWVFTAGETVQEVKPLVDGSSPGAVHDSLNDYSQVQSEIRQMGDHEAHLPSSAGDGILSLPNFNMKERSTDGMMVYREVFMTADVIEENNDTTSVNAKSMWPAPTDQAELKTPQQVLSKTSPGPSCIQQGVLMTAEVKDENGGDTDTSQNILKPVRQLRDETGLKTWQEGLSTRSPGPACTEESCKAHNLECSKISDADRQRINTRFWNKLTPLERIAEIQSLGEQRPIWKLITPKGQEFLVCKNLVASTLGVRSAKLSFWLSWEPGKCKGQSISEEQFAFLDSFQLSMSYRPSQTVSSLYRRYVQLARERGERTVCDSVFRKRWAALKQTSATPWNVTDHVKAKLREEENRALPAYDGDSHVKTASPSIMVTSAIAEQKRCPAPPSGEVRIAPGAESGPASGKKVRDGNVGSVPSARRNFDDEDDEHRNEGCWSNEKHVLEPACTGTFCAKRNLQCGNISCSDRKRIHLRFQELTRNQKIKEVQSLIHIVPTMRMPCDMSPFPKTRYHYTLRTPEGEKLDVCQRLMVATLGVQGTTLYSWFKLRFLDRFLMKLLQNDRHTDIKDLYDQFVERARKSGQDVVSIGVFRQRYFDLRQDLVTSDKDANTDQLHDARREAAVVPSTSRSFEGVEHLGIGDDRGHERRLGPACTDASCRSRNLQCADISDFDRNRIHRRFWDELTPTKRVIEIQSLIRARKSSYEPRSSPSDRKTRYVYKLRTPEGKFFRVCPKLVVSTLDIPLDVLQSACSTRPTRNSDSLISFIRQLPPDNEQSETVNSLYRQYTEFVLQAVERPVSITTFRYRYKDLKVLGNYEEPGHCSTGFDTTRHHDDGGDNAELHEKSVNETDNKPGSNGFDEDNGLDKSVTGGEQPYVDEELRTDFSWNKIKSDTGDEQPYVDEELLRTDFSWNKIPDSRVKMEITPTDAEEMDVKLLFDESHEEGVHTSGRLMYLPRLDQSMNGSTSDTPRYDITVKYKTAQEFWVKELVLDHTYAKMEPESESAS